MSRNMQMRTRILPYYQGGFHKVYPKIAYSLRHMNQDFTENAPSLFELIGKWGKILHELEDNESVRNVFLKHRQSLSDLYETVEQQIGDWQLAKADQALYKIEDVFDDIERELAEIKD
jgi:hypothetical protein